MPQFAWVAGEKAEMVAVSPRIGPFCGAPCYHSNGTDELLVIVSVEPLLSPALFCPLACTGAVGNELWPIPDAL